MPYRVNDDLPDSVRNHLPRHAQDIYRKAFNHAYAAHDGDPRQEEASHRIAWAAVKRNYVKVRAGYISLILIRTAERAEANLFLWTILPLWTAPRRLRSFPTSVR